MGYLTETGLGSVALGGGARARALAAREGLAKLLLQLQMLSATYAGKKFLRSDDPTVVADDPAMRTITRPTEWKGSNVIVWPAADWFARSVDWQVALDTIRPYEAKLQDTAFALDRNLGVAVGSRRSAIVATHTLLHDLDYILGIRGSGLMAWLLVAAAGVAIVAASGKKKGRKRARRRRR